MGGLGYSWRFPRFFYVPENRKSLGETGVLGLLGERGARHLQEHLPWDWEEYSQKKRSSSRSLGVPRLLKSMLPKGVREEAARDGDAPEGLSSAAAAPVVLRRGGGGECAQIILLSSSNRVAGRRGVRRRPAGAVQGNLVLKCRRGMKHAPGTKWRRAKTNGAVQSSRGCCSQWLLATQS